MLNTLLSTVVLSDSFKIMESITTFVENFIIRWGFRDNSVPLLRHVILVLIVLAIAFLTDFICRKAIMPLIERITKHTSTKWDNVILGHPVLSAACGIIPAIVIWQLLPLVFYQYPMWKEVVARLAAIYMIIRIVHFCVVLINGFKNIDSGDRITLHQYIVSFCGLLKVLTFFIAVIIILSIIIGRNPLTLLAGLGATSAILMLVFKDTIESLVAGIRLTSADMIHIGDWITVPTTSADGTVIEMNLTTVKIQNFDNTIVTVSPTTLVNGSFQNWRGMEESGGRRVKRRVYFDFRSIHFVDEKREKTNLALYRETMEKYIEENPLVNPELTHMVRQLDATQAGLPVEFYFFLADKVWENYEHNLEHMMEYAYALAVEYDLRVFQCFPKQD